MVIGIPRAFLYYKYGTLWETFFKNLSVNYILSPETNKQILNAGLGVSIDESCLPAKIFLGHVENLIGKCNYILVPRIETLNKEDEVCVKFLGVYDIIQNTFAARLKSSDTGLLDYNVDVAKGKTEQKGFLNMGKLLGFSRRKIMNAYMKARAAQRSSDAQKAQNSLMLLKKAGPKILVAGHPYNVYDPAVGAPVIRYLEKLGITVILANEFDSGLCAAQAVNVSKTLYWTFNKELAGAVGLYKASADGIIFITAFPCGPDSLVTELMMRKFRGIPKLNLVVDELQSESGLHTRLESFTDIILQRRNMISEHSEVILGGIAPGGIWA